MAISDIPGYVQGFRLSDDSAHYDSTAKLFYDKAGYGNFNGLTIHVGTPVFSTDATSGQRGLLCDNTFHGKFLMAIPWEGALIMVVKPVDFDAATGDVSPIIFGKATSLSSNGIFNIGHNSGTFTHALYNPSFTIQCANAYNSGDKSGIKVGGFAYGQEARRGYFTKDGVTVSQTSAIAANATGIGFEGKNTARTDCQFARFGNLNGTLDNTTATTRKAHVFEMHFFKGNPLVDAASTVATEIAALKATYGAT